MFQDTMDVMLHTFESCALWSHEIVHMQLASGDFVGKMLYLSIIKYSHAQARTQLHVQQQTYIDTGRDMQTFRHLSLFRFRCRFVCVRDRARRSCAAQEPWLVFLYFYFVWKFVSAALSFRLCARSGEAKLWSASAMARFLCFYSFDVYLFIYNFYRGRYLSAKKKSGSRCTICCPCVGKNTGYWNWASGHWLRLVLEHCAVDRRRHHGSGALQKEYHTLLWRLKSHTCGRS